ncbi:MAG: DNA ligase (NAD(+)) LigA [Epulopiscium sp. Nuni2H_MBin003]|nr:MAG: DNA ligase (NAD(+)) LigA [Epulopiscium sp. Nuni2H_MBin003]
MDKLKRMAELVDLLEKANYSYEQKNEELISNFEYDKLYDELVNLEKELNIILSNSVTQKVGEQVASSLQKVAHNLPMLSLNKTKNIDELKNFLGDKMGLLTYKLDGLTIVLTYKNSELVQAVTRGNGQIGEDVTLNARTFKNLPIKIDYAKDLVIRGEAIITYSDFEKFSDAYKNPRNFCSGSVRQLDPKVTAKRDVRLIAFAVVESDETFITRSESLDFLDKLGFSVVSYKIVDKDIVEETIQQISTQVKESDCATDGLVLSFNDLQYSKTLGATSKFPKDSIAFKWKDEVANTTLLDIKWNTSRTGLINPIAIFEKVELEGTTIEKASVHNISILENLQLGKGDTISVYKANMIIPQIAENLTRTGPINLPRTCPVCDGDVVIRQENNTKHLYCINPNCSAKKLESFAHFVSRNAMNIEDLSKKTLEKFLALGYLEEFSDIFKLEKYKNQIIAQEGFGERSYQNLIDNINKARNIPLYQFIYALGILQVGVSTAKLICKHFDEDIQKICNASIEELIEIDGVGEVTAKAMVEFFNKYKSIIENLLVEVKFQSYKKVSDKLTKLTFVITGELSHFANRKALQQYIEQQGGKVTATISKNTNYLINNDINSTSSKNKKAKQLEIPILTEEMFLEMFSG